MQANARTFHAFSRDRGLPDRGVFSRLAPNKIPVYAVWLVCLISGGFYFVCDENSSLTTNNPSALLGLLSLASVTAVNAVFSLCAIALDTSYVIPIICKLIFRDHPDVMYRPGPFDLGVGVLGKFVNVAAVVWTIIVVVRFLSLRLE